MQGIIYDPTDRQFIQMTMEFCKHIPTCSNCSELIDSEGTHIIIQVFDCLNDISMHPIAPKDYAAAVDFCQHWLQIDAVLQLVDGMTGEIHAAN